MSFFSKKSINTTVLDFIEGRISHKDFLVLCYENDEIFDWIQSIVPKRKKCYKNTIVKIPDSNGNSIEIVRQEKVPYDIRLVVKQFFEMDSDMLGNYLNLHNEISNLIKDSFPKEKIRISNKLEEQYMFMLDACPTYIGGNEVFQSGILEELFDSIPDNLSTEKQISWYKSRVKEIFHIESNHYPKWIQNAEWPMNNNRPMRFVSQEKAPEIGINFIFVDVETGEKRTVFQFT